MSCNCNCTPCCCNSSAAASCDPANEPYSSMLNNIISNLFGTLTRTCVDGEVLWTLPCNLATGNATFPRLAGESILCYNLRFLSYLLSQISSGAGVLAISAGGTGQTTASAALNALGGQPLASVLTALSNLASASGSLVNDGLGGLSWSGSTIGDWSLIEERYAAGVNGAASVIGWNKRGLNIVSYDPSNRVNNLAAGRFQMDVGTYFVISNAIAFATAAGTGMRDKLRINNFTDTVVISEGLSTYGSFNVSSSTLATQLSILTVANALKEYELGHYFEYADATGQGLAVGAVTGATYEKYAQLLLIKIA